MNVYRISDGGDDRLWKAESMDEAIKLAEDAYIKENTNCRPMTKAEAREREHYRTAMLESCVLLGELANP